MTNYSIDDATGTLLCAGLQGDVVAYRTAQRLANERGELVRLYESDALSEDEGGPAAEIIHPDVEDVAEASQFTITYAGQYESLLAIRGDLKHETREAAIKAIADLGFDADELVVEEGDDGGCRVYASQDDADADTDGSDPLAVISEE